MEALINVGLEFPAPLPTIGTLLPKHEWCWDEKLSSSSVKLSRNNLDVTFHPIYSTGTAVIKGNKPLEKDRHHFWEIDMVTQICGTDVMVGVGTANADFSDTDNIFCGLLGRDQHSWGFSYKGYVQHDGITYGYGISFRQDDLVGIHLDTWTGTLQFFINRQPLGIAFTSLNNVTLYPFASSTMAQSIMKLNYSCSLPVSLQTACISVLTPAQKTYLAKEFPTLMYLSHDIFANILQKKIDDDDETDSEFPLEDLNLDESIFIKTKKIKIEPIMNGIHHVL